MKTFYTKELKNLDGVLAAELSGVDKEKATFALYFHSSEHNAAEVAAAMEAALPGVPKMGCSTSGEVSTGYMGDGSLSVSVFDASTVAKASVESASRGGIGEALGKLQAPHGAVDITRQVGLVLLDGLSGAEEGFMDELGNLSDTTFVGGSAGDDLKFSKTFMSANGVVVSAEGMLALLDVPNGFELIKTQSFAIGSKKLVPTEVEFENRLVKAFDGKPAADAYAEALGVEKANLADHFMSHPLGLVAGTDPFVRSPMKLEGDHVKFYCAVMAGQELSVLDSTTIVADTKAALEATPAKGLVVFNCILRTLEIKAKGRQAEFGALFTVPTVGFSTYGEAYLGHINQTATILALK